MDKHKIDYRLYLATDREQLADRDLLDSVREALLGGVTLLQLREKRISSLEFYRLAVEVKKLAAEYKVPYIINDRLDIALAVDADGLHVGQDDLPAHIARRLLGPNKLIGVSAATVEEAVLAEEAGADYLGVGAIYATNTKGDARITSLDTLRQIKNAVNIPVVAIGGINHSNAKEIMATGIDGISVISAILGSNDIRNAARLLRNLI